MENLTGIKERFLKNKLAMRLGCIAADLARLKSFSGMPNNQKAIKDIIEESKFFIEWTAPKASLEVQENLVELQIKLALLNYSLNKQKEIAKFADRWSNKILNLSGLLKEDWL